MAQYTFAGYHLAAIPPSPNASSLGVYGIIPVDKYTGVPEIKIPIYNILNGDAKCDITLAYHIHENKVDQEASWVGLGWSLNAGGVISRIRRGLSDLTTNGGVTSHTFGYNCCTFYQPDDFYFNFPGYSGHFILDQQNHPILISQSDLIIENIDNTDNGFNIICPDGTKYIFDRKEFTYVSEVSGPRDSIQYYFPSTWYLTKIISPTYREINFTYTSTTFPSTSYSLVESYNDLQDLGGTNYCTGLSILPENEYTFLRTIQYNIYPTKIDFGLGEVNFTTNDRVDLLKLSGYSYPKRLAELSITDKSSLEIVRKFIFNSSYFVSAGSYPDYMNRRLKLESLIEKNASNQSNSIFTFEYEPTLLPVKYSKSTDYWGFYNGFTYPAETTVNNRDFSSNSTYSKACLLKKIVYPTGGFTTFEYEGNTFSNRTNMTQGGGNRIKRVISYDNNAIQCTEKRYEYSLTDGGGASSGKLILPILNQYPVIAVSLAVCNGQPTALYSTYNTTVKGNCLSLGTGSSGLMVGYSRVVEFEDETGSNGKTEFFYENTDLPLPTSFTDLIRAYYQIPSRNGLLSSEIISERVSDYYLVKRRIYETYAEENILNTAAEFPNIATRILAILDCPDQNNTYVDFNIKSSWIHPSSRKVVDYTQGIPQDSIVTVTQFYYESDYHKQLTMEVTTNNTVTLSTKYRYPDEILSDTVASAMLNFHRINQPIETIRKVNDRVVYASLIENDIYYATYVNNSLSRGLTLPSRILELETVSPLINYQQVRRYWSYDSRLKPEIVIDQYDNFGNVLQLKKTNDLLTSFIWGYNGSLMTATTQNASCNEIYFESFEDEKWLWDASNPDKPSRYIYDRHNGRYSLYVKNGQFGLSQIVDGLSQDRKYILSAWIKTEDGFDASNGNQANLIIQVIDKSNGQQLAWLTTWVTQTNGVWKLFERDIDLASYPQNVKLKIELWNSNNSKYLLADDVRFVPKDAEMTSFTYHPLLGITSVTDPNNISQLFEYDSFGRLKNVKDNDGKITSRNYYHYYNDTSSDTPYLNTSPTSMSFCSGASSSSLSITSNTSWAITDNATWLSVNTTSGTGNATITVSATANTSAARNATITITYAGGLTKTLSISQAAGTTSTLLVSPLIINYGSIAPLVTVTVTSNTSWTVTKSDSWITISATSGTGNGTITVRGTKLLSGTRSGTVTFKTTDNIVTRIVNVYQDAGLMQQ